MKRGQRLHEYPYGVAERQGGLFTARQAATLATATTRIRTTCGPATGSTNVEGSTGLALYPRPSRPDLVLSQLWSHNRAGEPQGTFNHATALTLHQLSDVMSRRLNLTVPPRFQRMAAIPAVLYPHHARLGDEDMETIDGVRVTDPLRTLVDVIADEALGRDLQVQAVHEAIRRGLIMRRQLETVKTTTRARQRIDRILKRVPDGDSTPVRNGRRVSRRPRSTPVRTVPS